MAIRALEQWRFFVDTFSPTIQLFLQVSGMIVTRGARHERNIRILQSFQITVRRNSQMTCHAVARVNFVAFVVSFVMAKF